MKIQNFRLIGPWGDLDKGPTYVRPENAGTLNRFGEILEAASGDLESCTIALSAADVQALGRALRRVAAGEDARHVFAQKKVGHRQDERHRKQTIAILYWQTFAERLANGMSPEQAKREAVDRARRHFTDKKINGATVTRYARTLRGPVLEFLDLRHRSGHGPGTETLRKHLDKHGEHIGDGPTLPPLRRRRGSD
jgi:hypothetical protein